MFRNSKNSCLKVFWHAICLLACELVIRARVHFLRRTNPANEIPFRDLMYDSIIVLKDTQKKWYNYANQE